MRKDISNSAVVQLIQQITEEHTAQIQLIRNDISNLKLVVLGLVFIQILTNPMIVSLITALISKL